MLFFKSVLYLFASKCTLVLDLRQIRLVGIFKPSWPVDPVSLLSDLYLRMPGANPWSGELKEKRKKSSASRQTSRQGEGKPSSPPPPPPHPHPTCETVDETSLLETERGSDSPLPSPPPPLDELLDSGGQCKLDTKGQQAPASCGTERSVTGPNPSSLKDNTRKVSKTGKKGQKEGIEAKQINQDTAGSARTLKDEAKDEALDETKDSDWLKDSRRKLKPVLQPFKRTEKKAELESPVDLLISTGVMENTSAGIYSYSSLLTLPFVSFFFSS